MKDDLQSDRTFNPRADSRSKALFLGMLVALGIGIVLMVAGALTAEVRWSVAGVLALLVAGAGHAWLQQQGEMTPVNRALEIFTQNHPPPDEARESQLLAMLEAWEALEEKRGTPEFDPWALQVLRNDIRKVVESDPALSRLFSELQRAA